MKNSSVKPHILSWLQRDPAAGVQPFVFTPNLQARTPKPHRSHLITRACLASTTSDFLLVDRTNHRTSRGKLAWKIAAAALVVCITGPAKTTPSKVPVVIEKTSCEVNTSD